MPTKARIVTAERHDSTGGGPTACHQDRPDPPLGCRDNRWFVAAGRSVRSTFNDIRSLERGLAGTAHPEDPNLVVHDRKNATVRGSVSGLEQYLPQLELELGVFRRDRASQRLQDDPFCTGQECSIPSGRTLR
jgi:hypothetical protein